jgi:SAM-dependent methyltransferase
MLMDPYQVIAKYYDSAYAAKQDLVDLPFYLDLAAKSGGPVLEIACGTGRVLLPIARKGIEVHGVDNSPAMLAVLKDSLARESQEVRSRVNLHEGDMRSFRLAREYALVIIPFRPMQHMFSVEHQVAALKTASAHMDENGILAFDVFFPNFTMIPAKVGEEQMELEWPSPSDPSLIVRRYFRKESVDKINQSFRFTFIFRTYKGSDLLHEETEPFAMAYYTYPQLRALFLLAGLEPVAEYGSFDRTPLDNNSEQMIFLLRKTVASTL